MKDIDIDVGSKIRAYRKRKKLSLVELSRRTGIAASNLSAIELNKSSPTLITLAKIARAFGLRIGRFLDGVMYSKAVLCRGATQVMRKSSSSDSSTHLLTSEVAFNRMEAVLIVLKSGLQRVKAMEPGADRFLYCLDGAVTAAVDDQRYPLRPGDGFYLLPEAIASLEVADGEKAAILLVKTPVSEERAE
jgi:DNA-binding XRE family transcriptional regulator